MSRQPYVGRHRGGRHRLPRRRLPRVAAAAGGATSSALGVVVLSVTAAAGSGAEQSPAVARDSTSTPAVLSNAEVTREARVDRVADRRDAAAARPGRGGGPGVTRQGPGRPVKRQQRERAERLARVRSWVRPLDDYTLSSGFGPRWEERQHEGLDLASASGTRVGAISSGTVIFAGYQGAYGNKVEVRHWDGTISYYAHMSNIAVSVGQRLDPGDKVGEVGSTGRSTGPHLHLQILSADAAVDGYTWLRDRGIRL